MFSILFPRKNPFRRKKEENEVERVVWTRLNLSLTGEGDEKGGKERRTMRTEEGDIR